MNRIEQKFGDLKRRKKKAFIAFLTAGDPNLRITEELIVSFERHGVDLVEIGVPFSDPLADGPTIQASSQRAIKRGVTLPKIFHLVARVRQKSQIPIALMTYYNPVYHYGEQKFIRDAKESGVDGIIVPDLPPEEAGCICRFAKTSSLSTVFFLSPTTTKARIQKIVRASTGFIYYVSLTGVTGVHKGFSSQNAAQIQLARRSTKKPICVGFGVSTPAQVRAIAKMADGVIVGSAIVDRINKHKGKKNLVKNISQFVWALAKGLS